MTRLRYIIAVTALLFCGATVVAQNITNKGTDFWVAYGHHQYMETSCNGLTPGENTQNMTLYISNGENQTARVKITIDSSSTIPNPLNWWSRTYDIPANTVISIEAATAIAQTGSAGTAPSSIPKGTAGTYDARLITDAPPAGTGGEGIFRKKGIHIQAIANASGVVVPVVAYAHIYGSVSSGATMLMPTNAWGYSYTTINSFQGNDVDRSFSWVFVMASQDSTYVEITPSQPSRLGKPKNVPFTVLLMKGQIYQLIGQATCSNGVGPQLTGTKVRSIALNNTTCKPIAVFAGCSRTGGEIPTCGPSGRDNDFQQCFPESAWGKRYLTAPASKSSGSSNLQPSSFQNHVYKVAVKDPTTVVKRNGVQIPLASLIEGKYYQFASSTSDYIEADKPVMLAMFFSNGSSCNSAGDGDPEMIYLSPIEQAIKKVVLLRNNKEAINSNWVTLIIPTAGLATLRIDGAALTNGVNNVYIGAHNNKAGYSVVAKGWPSAANTQVTIASDSGFNAYTYGMGGAESYGYNAGTNINNLNAISHIRNTPDTNSTITQHNYTYVNTPVVISALIAYKATKITWLRSALGCAVIQRCTDTTVVNPTLIDSVLIGSAWYYRYSIGVHTFLKEGTYYLPIDVESPVEGAGSGCSNVERLYLEIIVKPKPYAKFTTTIRGCGKDTVCFSGVTPTSNGYAVTDWAWEFPGGGTSNVQNPCVLLDTGYHNIKLSIIVAQGGVADTTITIRVAPRPIAKFGINPNPACPGPVSFIDTSTYTGPTPITNWYWNLSPTIINAPTNANQTATYTAGTYTIYHAVKVNDYCISDTISKTLTVTNGAVIDFTYPTDCIPYTGVAQFTSNASNLPGVTYGWNFGDPGSGSANTSTAQNPTHTYAADGTYSVSLHVTTPTCAGDTTFNVVIKRKAQLTFTALSAVCRSAAPVSVANASPNGAGGNGYYYDGTGSTTSAGIFNPTTAGAGTHTIWYVFETTNGCKDSISQTIVVNAGAGKPVATTPVNYCQGNTAAPLSATPDPGNTLLWFNNPSLTGGSSTAPTPSTMTAGTVYYYVAQVTPSNCVSDTSTIAVNVTPAIDNNLIGSNQTICSNVAATAIDPSSTITGGTGTYDYLWQSAPASSGPWTNISGATNASYNPGMLSATTYFRRNVISGLCSSTSNEVIITVVPAIVNYDISADQSICEGNSPALLDGQTPSSGGTFTYGWESSADGVNWTVISGATSEDYQPGILTYSTYYRRKTENSSCSVYSNTVLVTVKPLANGTISGPTAICQYNSADITFVASTGTPPFGISYTVTNPSSASTTYTPTGLANNAVIPVIPIGSAAGNYTIVLNSITNSNGCIKNTGLNTITITVTATPVITITPVAAICEGATATLTASGATTYQWSTSSPNANLGGTTGSSVTATPTATSTYHVDGTTNGCTAGNDITVTVNPKPAKPTVTTPVTYCQNGTAVAVIASGAPGNTLTYYSNTALTGGVTTAPTPSTTTAGTFYYYVTQKSSAGCEGDTSTITIIVQPSIDNNIISADQTLCSGTAAAILNAASAPTGGDGTYTYQWQQSTDGGSVWNNISGATNASYDPSVLATTTKFRRIVNSNLCSNTSAAVTITVVPAITNYDISADQTICEGNTPANLTGQVPPGAGPFTYTWESSPDGAVWSVITGATGADYQPPSLTVTTYYHRKVVNGPCSATSNTVKITVNPLANGTISGPTAICGYDAASVTFTSSVGTAPFDVKLTITDPSSTTSTITQSVNSGGTINVIPAGSAPGNYTIAFTSLTNSNGCIRTTGLNTITITVNAVPVVTIDPAGPICDGKSATLMAHGATTYVWTGTALSSTTGSSVTANPSDGTYNYSVTGTINGCNATASTTLIVNPTPVKPSVTTPVNYCQLASAVPLEAVGGNAMTVKWYDNPGLTGGVTTAPTPSTINAGTFYYYVTQTNSFGCESDTAITTVIVAPGITGNAISADQNICQGSTPAGLVNAGTLSGGTGTYTYQWQQSIDNTNWNNIPGATSADYAPGVLNTTTYYRRLVTSTLCGSVSNVVTVHVFIGLSNYDISANQTICEGSTPAQLDGQTTGGTGPFTYTWQQSTDGGANWSDIPSSNTEDYQPPALTASTSYRRKVTNGPCTAYSNVVVITVNPLAVGTISGPTAICEYESANITLNTTVGTAPFSVVLTVTDPSGASSTITQSVNNGGTINVIPLNSAAGNYTVALTSLTNSNGCVRTTGLNSITITVKPTPVITVNPVAPICEGDSAVLTANGATTYTWAGSNLGSTSGNPVKAAPTANTAYTVTGTTNGCSAQQTATVTVNPRPTVNIVIADNDICLNQNGVFSATSGIASGSIQDYHWDFDNGNTPVVTNTNPISQSYTTHRVYVTRLYAVSDLGCASATDTAHINVNPLPVANFQVPSFVCLPNNLATFQNQTTIANGAPLNYAWNFGDPASGSANTSNATNGSHVYPDSANYSITLSVVSAQGCAHQVTKDFSAFFNKPVAKFGVTPDTLCQGIQNLFVDSSFAPGSSIQKRLWLFGDGNTMQDSLSPAKIYTRPGNYKVALVVQSTQGCVSDTAFKNIIVYLQPVIDGGPSFVVPVGTLVTFNATANSNSLQFAWTSPTGGTLSNPHILKPQYMANQDGKFIITATGQGNCHASDSVTVKVLLPIVIPNAFSPNNDGINDKWEITNLADYPNSVVEVYNRYGQAVFKAYGGYSQPWDGKMNGKELPIGTYYYIIEPKNGFPRMTGYVVILK